MLTWHVLQIHGWRKGVEIILAFFSFHLLFFHFRYLYITLPSPKRLPKAVHNTLQTFQAGWLVSWLVGNVYQDAMLLSRPLIQQSPKFECLCLIWVTRQGYYSIGLPAPSPPIACLPAWAGQHDPGGWSQLGRWSSVTSTSRWQFHLWVKLHNFHRFVSISFWSHF